MLGFISDLHLEPLDNERTQAFYNFLEEVSQKYESLYILGDLFEYWIGDDDDSSVILQIKQSLNSVAHACSGAECSQCYTLTAAPNRAQ